jgi:sn-glycerol 3-phosphate transport system permease protein
MMEVAEARAITTHDDTPYSSKPRIGVHVALILVCFIMCIPALYALQVATLDLVQSFAAPPQLFPPGASFGTNVASLFERGGFGGLIVNTVIVSAVVVVGKTALALLAGLAFVFFRFPMKTFLFFFVLLTLLLPTEIILLPLFNMMSELGWAQTNPRLALTIPFLATATGAFLFRQHFSNIPRELAEAAQIDGASPLRFLMSILIPMSWNVIVAHSLIQFISSWNQYLWPVLIVQQNEAAHVIQMGVRAAAGAGGQPNYGVLMTAGIIASLPPLILFVLMQKQFMSGFAITRDK